MKNPRQVYLLFALAGIFVSCSGQGNEVQNSNAIAKDIQLSEMPDLIAQKNPLLLDVRTPGECELGIIEGAVVIDINNPDFNSSVSELDKNKPIIIYCKSGGRSAKAMKIMHGMGFTELYNLQGGYDLYSTQSSE